MRLIIYLTPSHPHLLDHGIHEVCPSGPERVVVGLNELNLEVRGHHEFQPHHQKVGGCSTQNWLCCMEKVKIFLLMPHKNKPV